MSARTFALGLAYGVTLGLLLRTLLDAGEKSSPQRPTQGPTVTALYAVAVPALVALVRGIQALADAADRTACKFANDTEEEL